MSVLSFLQDITGPMDMAIITAKYMYNDKCVHLKRKSSCFESTQTLHKKLIWNFSPEQYKPFPFCDINKFCFCVIWVILKKYLHDILRESIW